MNPATRLSLIGTVAICCIVGAFALFLANIPNIVMQPNPDKAMLYLGLFVVVVVSCAMIFKYTGRQLNYLKHNNIHPHKASDPIRLVAIILFMMTYAFMKLPHEEIIAHLPEPAAHATTPPAGGQ